MSEGAFLIDGSYAYTVYVTIQHPTLPITATLETGNGPFADPQPAEFSNWFGDEFTVFTQGGQMVVYVGTVGFGGDVISGPVDFPEGYMFDMMRWMG